MRRKSGENRMMECPDCATKLDLLNQLWFQFFKLCQDVEDEVGEIKAVMDIPEMASLRDKLRKAGVIMVPFSHNEI